MDVNKELKIWENSRKKNKGVGRGGWSGGVSGWGEVRVDVNAMFWVGVMWGMGDVNQE